MLSLHILDHIPTGLLQTPVAGLQELLGGPTLLHLPGRRERPLFVSVLLHGNEDTGFYAVQELLKAYHGRELPRALSVFIGNLEAASFGLRHLPEQPDYNRVWPGGVAQNSAEAALMRNVLEEMWPRRPFASIDIHNNTGRNPHYACINRLEPEFFHLATLFSRTVVYFTRPSGVQSLAFAALCPAVTVECGLAGKRQGWEHALEYLEAILNLAEFPEHPVAPQDIDLLHTVAVVQVPEALSFEFGVSGAADLVFRQDLDHLNFCELPAGTLLGHVRECTGVCLSAWNESGEEVGGAYFSVEGGELHIRRSFIPAMLTLDRRVIRQDCLGYVMERYPYPVPES